MFPEAIQFRDIHATLGNPWWPPAPGWWLLLAALLLLALGLWRFDLLWRLRLPVPTLRLGSWRWEAARELRRLRRDLATAPIKDSACGLSELLRRIAMARHGRAACAGLNGADWLGWLATHDPRGFDWPGRGKLLLNAPYAPPGQSEPARAVLLDLIDASMNWVVAGNPKPSKTAAGQAAPSQATRAMAWLQVRLPWRSRSTGLLASSDSTVAAAAGANSPADATDRPADAADGPADAAGARGSG